MTVTCSVILELCIPCFQPNFEISLAVTIFYVLQKVKRGETALKLHIYTMSESFSFLQGQTVVQKDILCHGFISMPVYKQVTFHLFFASSQCQECSIVLYH